MGPSGLCGGYGYIGGLYSCVSSTSSATATPTTMTSMTSGLGSSATDHTLTPSSSVRPYFYKHMITSRKSFNREIKNLLDIAENKTRVLCKVYDSSMSEETTTNAASPPNSAANTNQNCLHSDIRPSSFSFLRGGNSKDKQLSPKDYKKIIDMNYSNLRKKQSNVLNKVKLWDQLLESGSLNIASWGKNFFEFS